MSADASWFDDGAVPMGLLRERAYNLRWAVQAPDVIALTAADPDFAVAPPIREALADYVRDGVFSYGPAEGLPELRRACAGFMARRRGVAVPAEHILAVDSAAAGLLHVARFALLPGDEAIVFDPVDFLFAASVEAAGGRVVRLPSDPATGRVDIARLAALVGPRTRLIGVCNPVNPTGRVLSREELAAIGEVAVERGLWIASDEIWSDIVFDGRPFTSLASLGPAIAARTFTVYGFSKTFGLAGLRVGFVACPSPETFEALLAVSAARTTMTGVSTLSQVAAIAACERGWPWAEAFVAHLQTLRDLGVARLGAVPGVRVRPPEGTYVLFPDVSALGVPVERLAETLRDTYRVAVVPGSPRWFGPGADGHLRLVFSTSRALFEEGLERVARGLEACLAEGHGR